MFRVNVLQKFLKFENRDIKRMQSEDNVFAFSVGYILLIGFSTYQITKTAIIEGIKTERFYDDNFQRNKNEMLTSNNI